ncbi:AP endonuclease [Parascardovia denticolens IPLA 20019]|nr:sugar phosphate isomerase/epimerase family protein [Parascardovia denticolens]EIT88051.1 AP endonuclease [Parascardovia denticolens IPLA 20019]
MINIAVRGHDVSNVTTIPQLANKLQEYGVHGVQLSLPIQFPEISDGKKMNPGLGAYCRRVFSSADVQIVVLSCYFNMIHPDSVYRRQLIRRFKNYLRFAGCFGADFVASETGSVRPIPNVYDPKNFAEESYTAVRAVIEELVSYGEEVGCRVAIEPGINHPICSLSKTLRILHEISSPWLGVIFDPTSLVCAHNVEELPRIIEKGFDSLCDDIFAIHVRDFTVVPGQEQVQTCDNGLGVLPTTHILDLVKTNKPMASVVFEETKGDAIRSIVDRYSEY